MKTSHTFPSLTKYCFTRKAYGDTGTSARAGVTTQMALKAQSWLRMGSCVMLEGMNKTRGIGEHMGISLLSCVIQPERMQSPAFFFFFCPLVLIFYLIYMFLSLVIFNSCLSILLPTFRKDCLKSFVEQSERYTLNPSIPLPAPSINTVVGAMQD